MNDSHRVFSLIAVAAATILLIGSWTPFQFSANSFGDAWASFWAVYPLPRFSRSDVVVNFWLGMPVSLGLCGWLAAHHCSVGRRVGLAIVVVSAQVLLSMTAELGQGWLADRTSSVFDFGLQVAGSITAVVLWQYAGDGVVRRVEMLVANNHAGAASATAAATRIDAAISLIAAGVLIWAVMPLDIVTSPAELARKFRPGSIELVPFQRWDASWWENVYQWIASFVLGCPLGLGWGRWVVKRLVAERREPSGIAALILVAIGIGVLPELLQIPIRSRVASATDAMFLAAGSVVGTLLAVEISAGRLRSFVPRWRETWHSPGFWLGLACLQMLAICLLAWLPLDFCTDPAIIRQRWEIFIAAPLQGPVGNDSLHALTLFRSGILGAVLGGSTAMFFNRLKLNDPGMRRCAALTMMDVAVIAGLAVFVVSVELVQLLEPSRTCGMFSAIVQLTGVIVGYWVGRSSFGDP